MGNRSSTGALAAWCSSAKRSWRPFLRRVFRRAENPHSVRGREGSDAPGPAGRTSPAAAAGRCDGTVGFDEYERRPARPDAAPAAVAAEGTFGTFSQAFAARGRIGDRKRRLIIHAGTPKTGTTSLQRYLGAHQRSLAERGWWYPPWGDEQTPKHQWLARVLVGEDAPAFAEHAEAALRDMPEHAHTVIFSTEGIFNHWWDFTPKAKGFLRHLAGLFDSELCVWFRPPDEFAASLYVQFLTNPRIAGAPGNVYGRDLGFAEAMQDEWFRRHLDYLGFCREAQELFGQGRVKAFAYTGDTVRAFLERYRIDLPPGDAPRENLSVRRPGVEMMRIVNRYGLEDAERERVLGLVREIDGVIGERAERFRLRGAERALVARHAREGWDALRQSPFYEDESVPR